MECILTNEIMITPRKAANSGSGLPVCYGKKHACRKTTVIHLAYSGKTSCNVSNYPDVFLSPALQMLASSNGIKNAPVVETTGAKP